MPHSSWPLFRVCAITVAVLVGSCTATPPVRHLAPAQDTPEIGDLLRRADLGELEAQHDLCYRSKYGRGLPQDYQVAATWCTRAAIHGAESSQVLLAEMYLNGQGFEKNLAEALRWYKAAAEQEHPHALYMLYVMYSEGVGVEVNQQLAHAYLIRAAREGSEYAREELKKTEGHRQGPFREVQ